MFGRARRSLRAQHHWKTLLSASAFSPAGRLGFSRSAVTFPPKERLLVPRRYVNSVISWRFFTLSSLTVLHCIFFLIL